ncbi:MAG TPA: hypothetical protein VKU84_09725, partial [Stellaceae bacterium]|nr:hypothetical protein [Stellaceae bacterium]
RHPPAGRGDLGAADGNLTFDRMNAICVRLGSDAVNVGSHPNVGCVREKMKITNQSQFCERNQRSWLPAKPIQSQLKANFAARSGNFSALRPSTHALSRVAQDEANCVWQTENLFILSHGATHRESKDARRSSSAPGAQSV